MRWLTVSQTIAIVAGGVILPYYITVLQEAAGSYSLFAYIYALFTAVSAITHLMMGKLLGFFHWRTLLVVGNGMAAVGLFMVPQVSVLWQFAVIQIILGISISLQKSGEKVGVAEVTKSADRGVLIGNYHALTSFGTAAAFLGVGWFLNTFSLVFLFYLAALWYIIASILSYKIST